MKDYWKKFLCTLALVPGVMSLAACNIFNDNTPSTEQGSGSSGTQSGSQSGTTGESTQLNKESAYTKLRTNSTALVGDNASFEATGIEKMKMAMVLDEEKFKSENAEFITSIGGVESPTYTGMIQSINMIFSMFSSDMQAKTINGYKGSTGEGYKQSYMYDSEEEEYVKSESTHVIKDDDKLIKYVHEIDSYDPTDESKTKKYVGDDYSNVILRDKGILSEVGIQKFIDNETFKDYKEEIIDQMMMSFPVDSDEDLTQCMTVVSDITFENDKYTLKNDVTITDLPVDMDGLEMELDGSATMSVIFTEEGIDSFDMKIDLDGTAEAEEEGLVMPVDVDLELDMNVAMDDYNTNSEANSTYLADFVGTGTEGTIVKERGGFKYYVDSYNIESDIADFGTTITGAKSVADVVADEWESIAEYYDLENAKWYVDYDMTHLASNEILSMTKTPSYEIELYAKPELKSEYVRLNVYGYEEDNISSFHADTVYLPVASGQTTVTLTRDQFFNTYFYSDETGCGLASNSVIASGTMNDEALLGDSITMEGGKEYDIEITFSKASFVENNEIKYSVIEMTESVFQQYVSTGNMFSYSKQYTIETLEDYDADDESTHSKNLTIAEVFTLIGYDTEGRNVSAVYLEGDYINDYKDSLSTILTVTGGNEYTIFVVVADSVGE